MLRPFLRSFLVSTLILAAVLVPLMALAQVATGTAPGVADAIAALYPKAAPYVALMPFAQLAAKLLAPIPGRIFGYTHSTIWSRFFDTIAAFPAAPATRPPPPKA